MDDEEVIRLELFVNDYCVLLLTGIYSSFFLSVFLVLIGIDRSYIFVNIFQLLLTLNYSCLHPFFKIIYCLPS